MLKKLLDDHKHASITAIVAALRLNQLLQMPTVLRFVLATEAEFFGSMVRNHAALLEEE